MGNKYKVGDIVEFIYSGNQYRIVEYHRRGSFKGKMIKRAPGSRPQIIEEQVLTENLTEFVRSNEDDPVYKELFV